MVDLKPTLEALANNEIAIPEVQVMFQSLLQKQQITGQQLQQTLTQALEAGLITSEQARRLDISADVQPLPEEDEDDDATVLATPQGSAPQADPDDEDATVIAYPGNPQPSDDDEDEDATVIATPPNQDTQLTRYEQAAPTDDEDEDATVIANPGQAPDTQLTQFSEEEGDSTGQSTSRTSTSSRTSSITSSTGYSTTNTSQRSWDLPGATNPQLKKLGPGSIIKDRFILDKVLGAGGMGKVFQARDLLKVEAKDSNPYVAMKVLTEDFKAHPQAFVALQREASRQQKLAHPNIATVYDFDRIGMTGTQVFITMELLVGKPLDNFIRKVVRPKGGLPFEEAFPLIEQLGAALSYAHQRNIVHSDFKPGNAFLCDDGTVKTLDFGIARAVNASAEEEKDKQDDEFDAGDLGALTPAYASLEMLQGKDPSTQDDLYALAVVAYELLTGYHPFNKKSALKAQEAKLVPTPIKGLKKRQMKGLLRGLAFEKEKRTPTVEKFLEELEGKANWHKNPWVLGTAFSIILGVAAYNPAMNFLDELYVNRLIDQVQTQETHLIENVIAELPQLEVNARNRITDTTRDVLQTYLQGLMNMAVNVDEGRYDFDRAAHELARMEQLYPDSAAAIGLRNHLDLERNRYLHQLGQRLNLAIESDHLLPGEDYPESISEILSLIIAVRPDHNLLNDPRIPDAYATAAQEAINLGELNEARTFLDLGLARMPEDIDLINTQDRWNLAVERQERQARIEQLRESFGEQETAFTSLDTFISEKDNLMELSRLSPGDPGLQILGSLAAPLLVQESDALLEEHQNLWMALGQQLLLIERGIGPQAAERELEELLENPDIGRSWESDVQRLLTWLEASPGTDSTTLAGYQEQLRGIYLEASEELEENSRYNLALALIDRAEGLGLSGDLLTEARNRIDEDYQEFLSEREEAAQLARVEGMQNTLLVQAAAREVDEAEATLRELRRYMEDDDPFLTITAADALAEAYLELTNNLGAQGDYRDAVRMADRGLDLAPNDLQLQNARDNFQVEGNIEELNQLFTEAEHFDTPAAERMLDEIRTHAPGRFNELERQYTNILIDRILGVADSSRSEAESLASRASILFPGNNRLARLRADLAPPPWPQGRTARAALSTGRLTEAQAMLEASKERLPDHPEVLDFEKDLTARIQEAESTFARFEETLEAENFDEARSHLGQARQLWSDNTTYRGAIARLSERMAAQRWQGQILQRDMDIRSLRASEEITGAEVAGQEWDPIESNRPCTEDLAGFGRRARAICFDMLHERVRGPLMVVVPGDEEQSSFAISKYEISNEDWNKYCFLSGQCPVDVDQDQDLPRTGLSIDDVRDYTEWLSARTDKTYRLPSLQEWHHAAYAQGQQPPRDYNCRVRLGGQVLKGDQINRVSTGHQNGWGLQNFIGNVQELTVSNGQLVAVGGSYQDPHAECGIDFTRNHSGAADGVTGFRLIREEVVSTQLQSAQTE
ncbi:Serine/threonine protein kinase [Marinospirillum celere]|uniref:Serine/threonine protein kinase n=1 Tax=Marinospirillum celere TaxID=1122252 RepID=A0A1I1HZC3_9GAMM|nr:bifunctional serine/threonine-protein kinase/formylglycine-generating enzyme family protein [Marinospirillum celere]SFC26310.1 Serine/threonine protein kinase [Marinospirillum celere]